MPRGPACVCGPTTTTGRARRRRARRGARARPAPPPAPTAPLGSRCRPAATGSTPTSTGWFARSTSESRWDDPCCAAPVRPPRPGRLRLRRGRGAQGGGRAAGDPRLRRAAGALGAVRARARGPDGDAPAAVALRRDHPLRRALRAVDRGGEGRGCERQARLVLLRERPGVVGGSGGVLGASPRRGAVGLPALGQGDAGAGDRGSFPPAVPERGGGQALPGP